MWGCRAVYQGVDFPTLPHSLSPLFLSLSLFSLSLFHTHTHTHTQYADEYRFMVLDDYVHADVYVVDFSGIKKEMAECA